MWAKTLQAVTTRAGPCSSTRRVAAAGLRNSSTTRQPAARGDPGDVRRGLKPDRAHRKAVERSQEYSVVRPDVDDEVPRGEEPLVKRPGERREVVPQGRGRGSEEAVVLEEQLAAHRLQGLHLAALGTDREGQRKRQLRPGLLRANEAPGKRHRPELKKRVKGGPAADPAVVSPGVVGRLLRRDHDPGSSQAAARAAVRVSQIRSCSSWRSSGRTGSPAKLRRDASVRTLRGSSTGRRERSIP